MDITQFIEKHGKPAFIDLLNIIQINNWKQPEGGWRMYCIRHKMVTRNTKTVRCMWGDKKENYWYMLDGKYTRHEIPKIQYTTILRNGSNRIIFELRFTQEQFDEWREQQ